MATSKPQVVKENFHGGEEDHIEIVDSITEESDSDDSEEDPMYDILEETLSGFSKLSIKKSKSRLPKATGLGGMEVQDDVEIKVAELEEKDPVERFEKVEKMILDGQLDKLKVEQCKLYLRKNGLRLTGNKDILIERIREHLCIIDGSGETKYPVSSFVLNCKGDSCAGDVVLFEQNVYEMFSIASRSATGPPIGTRIVAGRIVKESYGAAKQQHTFTIEVLWSKGVKPLPPLHPLLIKGRNLYRLQTMRQRWADEEERRKVLLDKHSRGCLARSKRDTRIQEKELRKMFKGHRVSKKETGQSSASQQPTIQSRQQQEQRPIVTNAWFQQHKQANIQPQPSLLESQNSSNTCQQNSQKTNFIVDSMHYITPNYHQSYVQPLQNGCHIAERQNHFSPKDQRYRSSETFHPRQPLTSLNSCFPRSPQQMQHGNKQRQICQYFPQGRCYFGDNCKYLHENRERDVCGERREEMWPHRQGHCYGR